VSPQIQVFQKTDISLKNKTVRLRCTTFVLQCSALFLKSFLLRCDVIRISLYIFFFEQICVLKHDFCWEVFFHRLILKICSKIRSLIKRKLFTAILWHNLLSIFHLFFNITSVTQYTNMSLYIWFK